MERDYSDAFGGFPDVSKEDYADEERFNLDGAAAVDWFDQVEHPGWKAEAAYALVELAYGRAYETGEASDEQIAMDVHKNVAKPYMAFCFGDRDDLPDVDLAPYREGLEKLTSTTKSYGFQAQLSKAFPRPESVPYCYNDEHDYLEFADALTEQVDPEDYDVVFTAWSKGIPFLDVAADHLDLEPDQQVVIRYSPTLEDTEVQETPRMQERAAQEENRSFLFLDDVLMKGTTAEKSYEWAKEQGAERVDGFFMNVMDHTDHFDREQWPYAASNTLFNMDEQPATAEYRFREAKVSR